MMDDTVNPVFDMWCHTATDPRFKFDDGKPLPLLSVVLHRVCSNNPERFAEATRALRAAFEAGASAARTGSDA